MRSFVSMCAVMVGLGLSPAHAFQITSSAFNSNKVFQVQFEANTNSYYVLYSGTNLNDINLPINLAQGTGSVGQLFHTNAAGPLAFYRVRQIPNSPHPVLTSLNPPTATNQPGGTVTFTVNLDIPAPAGGTVVTLALNPPSAGTVPPTVTVPAGMTSASFNYVDGNTQPSVTVMAALGSLSLMSTINMPATASTLVINEVDYDNIGTDTAEFVEIYNGMATSASLTNLALVFINGNDNLEYLRVNLSGSLAAHAYLVVASSNVTVSAGATIVYFTNLSNIIQNGSPDGVVLFDFDNHNVVDALSYEGAITLAQITGELPFSLVEGTALSTSVADSNTANGSLIRNPDAHDTHDDNADWKFTTTPTPGAANVLTP